jgi:hypothetical protein
LNTNPKKLVAVAVGVILAFLFLVPVVSYAFPPGIYNCPANGCGFVHFGSLTYWRLGVGGVWTYANGYSVSTVTTTASYSVSSSVSYTVTAEPTHTATAVVDSANNLQLQLSLNASSSSATGVSISVLVDEYNPLATMNNVTAANEWVVALNGLNGAPCGGEENGWPVGFGVASGRYTSSNITDAKLLDLVNPTAFYNCPPYMGAFNGATAITFEPLSDTAAGTGCSNYCPAETVTAGTSLWGDVTGYWSQGGAFTNFPRGTYTVLAEDEWGNSAIAYFTVS